MNYAEIKYVNTANGPGSRTVLFVSGCTHHCKGCFNEVAWDFAYGHPFTAEVEQQILDSLAPVFIRGLTLLGGEPMEPVNQRALLPFVRKVRRLYPRKTIWCFSGYLYEELLPGGRAHCDATDELLSLMDVLVDGEFVQELADIMLRFRGSSNQRILDLPASRAAGQPVLWTGDPFFADHKM